MKRTAAAVPASLVTQLTERWQAGERLPALGKVASEQLKRHIAPVTVRGWIIKQVGGAEAFLEASIRRDEQHPRRKPKAPREPRAPREPSAPAVMDDSDVPRVKGAPVKEGWRVTSVRVRGRAEDVLVAPDGTRYMHARSNERADLVVDLSRKGLGEVRLRLEQTSSMTRHNRKEARLVKQGEKARSLKLAVVESTLQEET